MAFWPLKKITFLSDLAGASLDFARDKLLAQQDLNI